MSPATTYSDVLTEDASRNSFSENPSRNAEWP